MGDSIFSRISNLARANINAIIDGAEDPEKMIDQLVRDYTSAITDARGEVATVIGQLRLTEQDRDEATQSAAEWGNKAKAASRAADEASDPAEQARLNDLATVALRKQLSLEQEAERLTAKVTADTEVTNTLKANLQKMDVRLETLKTKRQELVSRSKMAKAQKTVQQAVSSVNAADPTSELARFEDRIRNEEAQVAGFKELESESLEEQFASLDRDAADAEVAQRLADLKAKTPA